MPDDAFDAIAEARGHWSGRGLPEPLAMAAATSIMRAQQIVARVPHAIAPASGSAVSSCSMVHSTGIT